MDYQLAELLVSFFQTLIWALSLWIAIPPVIKLIEAIIKLRHSKKEKKELEDKGLKNEKFLENNWRPKRTFTDPGEMELYNLKIENAIKEIDKEFNKNEKE